MGVCLRVLEVHGGRMIKHFDPGFRIEPQQKDLAIALCASDSVSAPNTATTQSLYNACVAQVVPMGQP